MHNTQEYVGQTSMVINSLERLEHLHLNSWQREAIDTILSPEVDRVVDISTGRRTGKTTLIAMMLRNTALGTSFVVVQNRQRARIYDVLGIHHGKILVWGELIRLQEFRHVDLVLFDDCRASDAPSNIYAHCNKVVSIYTPEDADLHRNYILHEAPHYYDTPTPPYGEMAETGDISQLENLIYTRAEEMIFNSGRREFRSYENDIDWFNEPRMKKEKEWDDETN